MMTRNRGGVEQAKCPCCGTWRPAFCIAALNEATAEAKGATHACDGCLTRWHRSDGEPLISDAIA